MRALKKVIAALIALCILLPLRGSLALAAEEEPAGKTSYQLPSPTIKGGYAEYIEKLRYPAGQAEIFAGWDSAVKNEFTESSEQPDDQYKTVYAVNSKGKAAFSLEVPENGAYNISLIFALAQDTAESFLFSLKLNGKYPFAECEALSVNALWQNSGGVRKLSNGDQVNSPAEHKEGFATRIITDTTGVQLFPYEFQLSKGAHIITLDVGQTPVILAGIKLNPPENLQSYKEASKAYADMPLYAGQQIIIEAEDPERVLYKSAYSLSAQSDSSSSSVTPRSPKNALLNYIGGNNWSSPDEEIAWSVDVPQDGLYKVGFSFKQNFANNGLVYRWLKVDGKTPFAEASKIAFGYKTKWQFNTFADENGEEYLLYLKKGIRKISLAVTLGDISEVFSRLAEIVEPLGSTYLEMVMITGESPDSNRDYELHKQIPDFSETLKEINSRIDALVKDIEGGLKVNGELSGALKNMSRILKSMSGSLFSAHLYIPNYYTAYQTLSAWLYDIKTMALSLDQIILASPKADFDTPEAGFFGKLSFGILRLFNSFFKNKSTVESVGDEKKPTLKIWVNWGRDQVKVLNTLIEDSFTPDTGVGVKVEQVNASLVQGVISGTSPDLYLQLARTEPVNLAMRGVLYDLKNFEDYESTLKNFQPGAEIPYRYKGGAYALPDTQAFYIMFYRSDILGQLGVEVPKTWEDFLSAAGVLQRNNMNTYLPYSRIVAATTVNTGAGGLSIFPTMLMQRGGEIYSDTGTGTALASQESVKAFTFWTDFYTKYSLDPDVNFQQRFRVGTIPLGITTYNQYLAFSATAPEIKGKWKIAEVPGYVNEGVIDNSVSGSGTGCAIMNSSENKEQAWSFLKWWVSEKTQYRYSAEIEAVLGESGRVATSNIKAMSRLSWDSDAREVLLSQWKKVREIPEVPGSYFVSRSIDQSFWAAKNKKQSPKEAITHWSEICDKEVARKTAEYPE